MIIAGYQPISLLDYPGKVCSIVFTQGCPFRCPYCHNPELIPVTPDRASEMKKEEFFAHLESHRNMVEAVCVTGGEPTIQRGLREFMAAVKGMGFAVKLDTNGINPDLVRGFIRDGIVDYIAMDLKHVWEKYRDVIRAGGDATISQCRETFGIIQSSGIGHEFRTTICPGAHTEADFMKMAGYLQPGERYYIQETRFGKTLAGLERTPFGFSLPGVIQSLRDTYPDLTIESR